MQEALIDYGDSRMRIELSDTAKIVTYGVDYTDPPFQYSNNYTYHPFHAISMLSGGSVPEKWCSRVFRVGAKAPKYARGLGYKPVNDFRTAMAQAEMIAGKNPGILCTPECFSGGAAVHLHTKNKKMRPSQGFYPKKTRKEIASTVL